jgi:DNA-binding NtrC family response regulator
MSTSIGVLGSISDALKNGLRERGHDVHDGNDDVIVIASASGDLPSFPAESVVIAISDAPAAAYRNGAFFVAPSSADAALASDLAERARSVFANRRAAAGLTSSTLATLEREAILSAMKASAGSTARAAAMLDISVRKVQYKLHEYGVPLTRRGTKDKASA